MLTETNDQNSEQFSRDSYYMTFYQNRFEFPNYDVSLSLKIVYTLTEIADPDGP